MTVRSAGWKRLAKRWARRGVVTADRLLSGGRGDLPAGLRILTYHRVAADPADPFAVTPADFERQMEILAATGQAVSLEEGLRRLDAGATEPSIAVTFDDGTVDFLDAAIPRLAERRLPSTLYVNPSRVGRPGFLGWSDLAGLGTARTEVGSHSLDHVSLGRLPAEAVRRQVVDSRRVLEDRLGRPVLTLAYPYGTLRDVNEVVMTEVRQAGYRAGCTSVNGVNRAQTPRMALRRTKIEQADTPIFAAILRGHLDGWAWFDEHFWRLQNRYA